MWRYTFIVFIAIYVASVESACPTLKKYYVDCTNTKTLVNTVQICTRYGMSLLNLTNSSTIINEISDLNQTLVSANCYSNFWYVTGNGTVYATSVNLLGDVLTGLLTGVVDLLGGVLNLITCLLFFCPATTTPPPITQAMVVCVRPMQQRVIQKCQFSMARTDMKVYRFNEQPMYGGILDSFALRSRTACSGLCSENATCIGISYIDGICSLYM